MPTYTPVPTKSTSDPWEITDWNTYVRDNFEATLPGIITLIGQMLVGTGSGTGSILNIGSNDQILVADSGETVGMKWAYDAIRDAVTAKGSIVIATASGTLGVLNPTYEHSFLVADSGESTGIRAESYPKAHGYGSSLSTGDPGHIQFRYELFDTHGFSTTVNGADAHFDIPSGQGGYYLVCLVCDIDVYPSSGDEEEIEMWKNDSTSLGILGGVGFYGSTPPSTGMFNFTDIVQLSGGDKFHLSFTGVADNIDKANVCLIRIG